VPGFSSRHRFQATTPCLSNATCSSFAMRAPRIVVRPNDSTVRSGVPQDKKGFRFPPSRPISFFLMQMIGGKPEVASRERSFALALLNYFEVTFWFAVWYSVLVRCGSLKITDSYPSGLSIFRESLAMMLVNSSNTFELTDSWWLWAAMCVQSIVGLFLTLMVVARTVASLPPLKAAP